MISTKTLKSLEIITKTLSEENEFTDVIYSLSNAYKINEKHLSDLLSIKDAASLVNHKESVKGSIVSEARSAIRRSKFSIISNAIHNIKTSLTGHEIPTLKAATLKVEEFVEAMDEHLHSETLATAINLTRSAFALEEKLSEIASIKETVELIANSQQKELPAVTIYIPNDISLESFSQKIDAVASILEICCKLLSMSTSEGSVCIEKIESGSFFAKISANQLVIALASIILTNGSQYIYNEIDSSKDLNNLKEASEILEKTLTIRTFLEENKFDTSEMDEEIKKSSAILAKSLGRLISDTQEIEINDNKIKNPTAKAALSSTTKQLENKQKSTND